MFLHHYKHFQMKHEPFISRCSSAFLRKPFVLSSVICHQLRSQHCSSPQLSYLFHFYLKGRLTEKGRARRGRFSIRCFTWQTDSMTAAEPVLKTGARSFLQVFHVSAGSQGFELSLTAFPGHNQGAGLKVK